MAQQPGIIRIRQRNDLIAPAVHKIQFSFNRCRHFMIFKGGYMAPGYTLYLNKFIFGCLENILGRLETINQTLG